MRRPIIKKFHYQGVPLEDLLDDAPLHPQATSVDESDFAESGGVGFVEILFDHRRDVSRGEGVEVESLFDG